MCLDLCVFLQTDHTKLVSVKLRYLYGVHRTRNRLVDLETYNIFIYLYNNG